MFFLKIAEYDKIGENEKEELDQQANRQMDLVTFGRLPLHQH